MIKAAMRLLDGAFGAMAATGIGCSIKDVQLKNRLRLFGYDYGGTVAA